ncbi:MAG: hypothetical protein WAK16_08515 [Candidatus Cybelea sp.]
METIGEKVSRLRDNLELLPASPGTASFTGRGLIAGTFFPGGLGLTDESRAGISTIVLGSDWGNEKSLEKALCGASMPASMSTTERKTSKMLKLAGFVVDDCWYSNAWPVMRSDNTEESGYHPMRDNPAFTSACRDFLRTCIEALAPKLIVTMGVGPAWFVGPLVGEGWALSKADVVYFCGPKKNGGNGMQMEVEPVRKDRIVYVAVTHPSNPHNVRHRELTRENRKMTNDDEIALLRCAREMADIPKAAQ